MGRINWNSEVLTEENNTQLASLMLIDRAIYSLPDGTHVRAVRKEGSWTMVEMLDGTPYVGVFSFGVQRLVYDRWGAVHTGPCDLCEEDLVFGRQ